MNVITSALVALALTLPLTGQAVAASETAPGVDVIVFDAPMVIAPAPSPNPPAVTVVSFEVPAIITPDAPSDCAPAPAPAPVEFVEFAPQHIRAATFPQVGQAGQAVQPAPRT